MVIHRSGIDNKTEEPQAAYYVSSRPPNPENFPAFPGLVRAHWGACEINNHWIRDAILGEDKTRSKNRNINANLAILRVALLAIKAHLLPHLTWPQVVETAQADTAFAYQLIVNHRPK